MNFPQDLSNVQALSKLFMSIIGIVLMAVSYTYIVKLEKIACSCSEHPYRNYIKNYIIFAIVFLLITMFFSPAMLTKMFGSSVAVLLGIVEVVFGLATFIFFIYAFKYANYLMKEKCKCSEDIRREVLYVWSILQIVLISINFIIPWIAGIAISSLGIVLTASKDLISKEPGMMREAAVNPLKAMRRVPKSLQSTTKMFRK